MTDWIKATKDFIWENKEGAIVGGLLGWFVIAPLLTKDATTVQSMQNMGLVDVVKSASTTAADFAIAKVKWFAVGLGTLIGIFFDMQLKEGFLKNFMRQR